MHLDSKFELIEAEFGLTGFAVVVKLLQRIYGADGYYGEWTEEVALLFSKSINLGGNAVSEIVGAAIKRGIFDEDLYIKYKILTSAGIQKRYFKAVDRRKKIEVKKQYLLINVDQICKNVCISSENVNISNKNVNIPEQRREEESKGEESIEETRADGGDNPNCSKLYQEKIGMLTGGICDALLYWLNLVEESLIEFAIDEAYEAKAFKWRYVEAVLKSHYNAGRRSRDEAEIYNEKREQNPKQSNTSSSNPFLDMMEEGDSFDA